MQLSQSLSVPPVTADQASNGTPAWHAHSWRGCGLLFNVLSIHSDDSLSGIIAILWQATSVKNFQKMCMYAVGGPIDFRGIQNLVPGAAEAPTSAAGTKSRMGNPHELPPPVQSAHTSENQPPTGVDACQRLHKFAEANGVEPDTILGGHKRKSDLSNMGVDAPGAKRPCTDVPSHSASAGGSCGHQTTTDAERFNTHVGGISTLADQLPGLRGAAMGTQSMTQPLHLTQREPMQQPIASAAGLAGASRSVQDPLRSARVRV